MSPGNAPLAIGARRLPRIASVIAVAAAMLVAPLVDTTVATAATTTMVSSVAELETAYRDATPNTEIVLSPMFPAALPATIKLDNAGDGPVTVDGGGLRLTAPPAGRHMEFTARGSGYAYLKNIEFGPAQGRSNGGLSVDMRDSVSVWVDDVTIADLGTTALSLAGNGTGDLTVENVTLNNNTAGSAAAFTFGRTSATAETRMHNVSVIDNVATSGGGYSGGAARFGPSSAGYVRIEYSLFSGNSMLEGGSQPRGGAIAMHQSNVQLELYNDYFVENSTASAGTPTNADGGAVSVYNTGPTNTASLNVHRTTFERNTAQDDGAAIFIEGRANTSSPPYPTKLQVMNSTFIDNVAGKQSSDSGGAIQVSLRVEVDIDTNTFVGNTKAPGGAGVDVGHFLGYNSGYGFQYPAGTVTNNIFTRSNSVALSSDMSCSGGVSCSIAAGKEDATALGVFGTTSPSAAKNDSRNFAGDSRVDQVAVPTVAIVPPIAVPGTPTASRVVPKSRQNGDQRGERYRLEGNQDAGSFSMDYVRFDATTNGGSWSGLTPTLPGSQGTFLSDESATGGWFEVTKPDRSVDALPTVDPTPPGPAEFLGWFDAPVGGEEVEAPVWATGQTVYAQYSQTHTVTFDPANGKNNWREVVKDGAVVPVPADPEHSWDIFAGWTLDGAAYDFNAPVTEDITLVATWEVIETGEMPHIVVFAPGNGQAPWADHAGNNEPVGEPTIPVREGYEFRGWLLNGEAYNFESPVTGNIVLEGDWKRLGYTVTFDAAGGSVTDGQDVWHGETAMKPAEPVRDGFVFEGWTLDGEGYNFDAPVTRNLTLVASWDEILVAIPSHIVMFLPANDVDAPWYAYATDGAPVDAPEDPVWPGHTFLSWEADGVAYKFETPVTANLVLTATWKQDEGVLQPHTVTFDPANGAKTTAVKVDDGDTVTAIKQPVRAGYTFDGWLLAGKPYDFKAPVTADLTLVAGWSKGSVPPPEKPGPDVTKPDPATPGEDSGLAATGSSNVPGIAVLGAGLVVLACALLLRARRRSA